MHLLPYCPPFQIQKILDIFQQHEQNNPALTPFYLYMKRKWNPEFMARMSWFYILSNADSYRTTCTNHAESANSGLNRFLSDNTNSNNFIELLTLVQVYYYNEYSKLEDQWTAQQSEYAPSDTAIINFQQKQNFVSKVLNKSERITDKNIRTTMESLKQYYD